SALAQEPSPSPTPDPKIEEDVQKLRDNIAEQERIRNELASLEKQERSLQSQITYSDSQIRLSSLKVAEARSKLVAAERDLAKLEVQIGELETRIGRLGSTLDQLSDVFEQRIQQTYVRTRLSPFELFLSSDGFGEFLARYRYLRIIQLNDRRLLAQLQATKSNYTDQKVSLEDKQTQVANAKVRIEKEKANLETNIETEEKLKRDKEALLRITQSDENRYRKILEVLQGEARTLANITIVNGLVSYSIEITNLNNLGSIGRGGSVGTMGNSGSPGCSTGSHLHFETLTGGSLTDGKLKGTLVDPSTKLSPKSVFYWTSNQSGELRSVGAGSWGWPINTPQVTQGYGQTSWSSRYSNNFHTALDIVPESYPGGDWTVSAAEGGTLYSGVLYYSGCSPINVRFIDHGSGNFSLYWHLQ
ncbi:MAG: hypothetical protein Q8R11_03955, partial [bacterium]|nr:hypothetical protein [bacterium]